MPEYKGYVGVTEIDEEAGVIFGRVLGLRDVITFQGETVGEARQAFRDSVDDYLEFCAERGENPEKPYSGKFVLRVRPELHRALATSAEMFKVSLNSLVEEVLSERFLSHASGTDSQG
jgi:predicted HicB family RNase H-like nuclease